MTSENNYVKKSKLKTNNHKKTIIIILCVIILVLCIGGAIIYMLSIDSNDLIGTWISQNTSSNNHIVFQEDGIMRTGKDGDRTTNYEVIDNRIIRVQEKDGSYDNLYYRIIGDKLFTGENSELLEMYIEQDDPLAIRYDE